ncbi:D-sedoheptulose-7-phosphate isomerase [Wenjunlia vitaminophila]|uniref:D-sedoheptulose-7-phosphate isomerase n=1 Tax=Wenjunlia vitaminophila TaxID=76728 RepID=UPI00035FF9D5|nr:SIS domain-containing protein [Wenjunlia vitaminophila]
MNAPLQHAEEHCRSLERALASLRSRHLPLLVRWGDDLAQLLPAGGRLLAAGNGGSAAQAQHLTAELVGRYQHDRPPFAAVALHAETSTVTAIGNDYGFDELYARQVAAHGRPGDVLVLLSTSGRSPNLLRAAAAGRAAGLTVWAMTGPSPNPLEEQVDDALCVDAPRPATVQELHLVALHLVCAAFDAALDRLLLWRSAEVTGPAPSAGAAPVLDGRPPGGGPRGTPLEREPGRHRERT